jgi:3',5'-cyclic AMP phosphodiesterase CpdA
MSQVISPESASQIRIIHFGDLHLWRFGWDSDPFPKRALGLGNLLLRRRRKFPPWVVRELIRNILLQEAGFVLFSGDLTTTGLTAEFDQGRTIFQSIRDRWKDNFISIPGNHDCYTPRADHRGYFENRFLRFPQDYPFVRNLNEKWDLVCFDCSVPRWISSRGHIDREQLEKLDGLLAIGRAAGRDIMVMGHYPLIYPGHVQVKWDHEFPERESVLKLLERHDVRVYLHGHVHRCWGLEKAGTIHLNCGSAGMVGRSPGETPGFLVIDAADSGRFKVSSIRMEPASINTTEGQVQWSSGGLAIQPYLES